MSLWVQAGCLLWLQALLYTGLQREGVCEGGAGRAAQREQICHVEEHLATERWVEPCLCWEGGEGGSGAGLPQATASCHGSEEGSCSSLAPLYSARPCLGLAQASDSLGQSPLGWLRPYSNLTPTSLQPHSNLAIELHRALLSTGRSRLAHKHAVAVVRPREHRHGGCLPHLLPLLLLLLWRGEEVAQPLRHQWLPLETQPGYAQRRSLGAHRVAAWVHRVAAWVHRVAA